LFSAFLDLALLLRLIPSDSTLRLFEHLTLLRFDTALLVCTLMGLVLLLGLLRTKLRQRDTQRRSQDSYREE